MRRPAPTARLPRRAPGRSSRPPTRRAANAVLMRAISLVGTPYRYGGNTPEGGFDCSGLVNYVYRDMLDLRLPRTSRDLAAVPGPEDRARAPGRRPTWCSSAAAATSATSASMSAKAASCMPPARGGTVRLDHLDGPYWRDHYSGAKRVLH